jgi:hypothetical protein
MLKRTTVETLDLREAETIREEILGQFLRQFRSIFIVGDLGESVKDFHSS